MANVIIPGSTPEIPADSRLNINAMLVHLNANVQVGPTHTPQAHPITHMCVQDPVCQYRRYLFPGLVYRPPNSPVVVLCFSSGKCVVTGGE